MFQTIIVVVMGSTLVYIIYKFNHLLRELNVKLDAKEDKLREQLEALHSADELNAMLREETQTLNTQLQIKTHDLQLFQHVNQTLIEDVACEKTSNMFLSECLEVSILSSKTQNSHLKGKNDQLIDELNKNNIANDQLTDELNKIYRANTALLHKLSAATKQCRHWKVLSAATNQCRIWEESEQLQAKNKLSTAPTPTGAVVRRIAAEARRMGRANHPNTCPMHQAGAVGRRIQGELTE